MEFTDFLVYLTTGGAVVASNWFASWYLEEEEWWHKMSTKSRKLIILGIAVLMGIGSHLLLTNEALMEVLLPYGQILFFTVSGWIGSQTAHKRNPDRRD